MQPSPIIAVIYRKPYSVGLTERDELEGGDMIRMLSAAAKVAAVLFVIEAAGDLTLHQAGSAVGLLFVGWLLFIAADQSEAKKRTDG